MFALYTRSTLPVQKANDSTNAYTFLSVTFDLLNYWITGKNSNIAAQVQLLMESMNNSVMSSGVETNLSLLYSLNIASNEKYYFLRGQSLSLEVSNEKKRTLLGASSAPTYSPSFAMIHSPTRSPVLSPTFSPTRSPFPQTDRSEIIDFPVNTYAVSNQAWPAVAALKDGGFFITWASSGRCCKPGESGGSGVVIGQQYSGAGIKNSEELFINDPITNITSDVNRQHPAITVLNDSSFVVTWSYINQQSNHNTGISGQQYTPEGIKIGTEFQITSYSFENSVSAPAIVGLRDGGFVIMWSHRHDSGYLSPYLYNNEVLGQRYTNEGLKNGAEFQVSANTNTNDILSFPAVSALNDGGFIVTYLVSRSSDPFSFAYDKNNLVGQRYTSTGIKNGTEFQINTRNIGYKDSSVITTLNDGSFVVVWDNYEQNSSHYGIFGQRYNDFGVKNGTEFQINTYTVFGQGSSFANYYGKSSLALAALNDGGFVVTWEDYDQDGSDYGIFGQRYTNFGTKKGTEFQVNTYSIDAQISSAVAGLNDGGFVVTWASDRQTSINCPNYNQYDFPDYDIFGQRFDANGDKVALPEESYKSTNSCSEPGEASGSVGLLIALVLGPSCGLICLLALCYRYGLLSCMKTRDTSSNNYAQANSTEPSSVKDLELVATIPETVIACSVTNTPSAPPLAIAELVQSFVTLGGDNEFSRIRNEEPKLDFLPVSIESVNQPKYVTRITLASELQSSEVTTKKQDQCKFFTGSSESCRKGSACKFAHSLNI